MNHHAIKCPHCNQKAYPNEDGSCYCCGKLLSGQPKTEHKKGETGRVLGLFGGLAVAAKRLVSVLTVDKLNSSEYEALIQLMNKLSTIEAEIGVITEEEMKEAS